MKIGIGYDIHKLVKGRKLVLGGVAIRSPKGLMGHSDADVLLHAICDAILGAAGLGDIGEHFPDNDKKYKNISSLKMLDEVKYFIVKKKLKVSNIDSMLILESPKISTYKNRMKKNIAKILKISPDRINIKATTNEGVGVIGMGSAAAALAVALLK